MTISDDILVFSESRPMWERDLLRRVYTQPELTEDDYGDVLSLIKISGGVEINSNAIGPSPLSADHVLHRPVGAPPVLLASIGDVKNAMQLAEKQTISFATDGVTVIYGENGSGKTGYCKLLKQVCRARREREDDVVLENAYSEAPRQSPTLTVRFRSGGGAVVPHKWTVGQAPPADLSRVSVFDSRLAPLYADKQDKIEFLPAGLDVLPRLAKGCEELGKRLDAEIAPIKAVVATALPAMIDGTEQSTLVALLNEKTPLLKIPTVGELDTLGAWTAEDAAKATQVESEMAADPTGRARTARQGVAILKAHIESLTAAAVLLSDEALTKLGSEIGACSAAKDAAQFAATEQFKKEPLSSVIGTPPWRQMFSYAAEVYSAAFPKRVFPSEGDAQICPLCQQTLEETAYDRIQRFHSLIAGVSQKDADSRALILTERAGALQKLMLQPIASVQTGLAAFAAEGTPEAIDVLSLTDWIEAGLARRALAVTAASGAKPLEELPSFPAGTVERISAWKTRLEAAAVADEAAAQDPKRVERLRGELNALKGRQQLNDNLAALKTRREQLIRLKKLTACIPARHTTAISTKNTELCQTHITEDFQKKLNAEMTALNIGYLPVTVRGRTEKGVSYVGPDLTKSIPARTSNILSEGEFRALSLACFFAEIATIDGHNGIILDDPVSSLDHNHIREVAARILAEAKRRQVIIFTHEISFYYELWYQAAEAKIPLSRHWVMKSNEHGFGTVRLDDAPWQAKPTKDRLAVLDAKLAALKAFGDKASEGYERAITDFFAGLRETWERLVEERLLNGVVGRFQPGVMTQSLSGVEVSQQDYETVYFAMKGASELSGHDWAKGRLPRVPQHEEMETAIKQARDYFKALNIRVAALQSVRKKEVEAPPAGKTI
jgi:energy-coupling factor transporter ATP-binding protein EcfA2